MAVVNRDVKENVLMIVQQHAAENVVKIVAKNVLVNVKDAINLALRNAISVVILVEKDAMVKKQWQPVILVIFYVQVHAKISAQIVVVQIVLEKQVRKLFIIAGFKIFKIINKKIGIVLIYYPYFFIFLNIILVINIISLYVVEIIIAPKSKLIIIH